MKFVIFILILALTNALVVDTEWNRFKQTFKRQFRTISEEERRHEIFRDNLKKSNNIIIIVIVRIKWD